MQQISDLTADPKEIQTLDQLMLDKDYQLDDSSECADKFPVNVDNIFDQDDQENLSKSELSSMNSVDRRLYEREKYYGFFKEAKFTAIRSPQIQLTKF